jgi:hypothetical protein
VKFDTPQQLDPLGGITARTIVIVGGIIAIVIAIAMTLANLSEISSPLLAVLALVALAATVAYYIRTSSPYRAPLLLHSHVIICLGALAAVLLDVFSQWGTNQLVRDDWGPISMACVVITLGAYRSPLELLACGIGSSAIVAGIAGLVFASGSLVTPVPYAVFAVTMVTPVFAAGVGAAAFSSSLIRASREGRDRDPVPRPPETVLMDAPTGHLAFLKGTVIPFLDGIVTSGELAESDGARARRLARELRVLMVLDSELSWLTGVIDRFDDPARLAQELDSAQRASLRAIVAHVQSSDAFAKRSARLRLGLDEGNAVGVLEVDVLSVPAARMQLAPYIAVARTTFPVAEMSLTSSRFALTFRF